MERLQQQFDGNIKMKNLDCKHLVLHLVFQHFFDLLYT